MKLITLEMALDRARAAGASYADARLLRQADEGLTVRNGQVEQARSGMSCGLGVRVLVDDQWGFAAGSVLSEAEAARLAGLAVEIARASGAVRKREVRLAPAPPAVDTWESACRIDPWSVPTSRKVDLLRDACRAAQSGGSDVRVAMAYMRAIREVKTFASTEGARITRRRPSAQQVCVQWRWDQERCRYGRTLEPSKATCAKQATSSSRRWTWLRMPNASERRHSPCFRRSNALPAR